MNGKKSFASNVIIILSAQIIVKILGMLYRMVITNADGFGDAGNGFYSAGFQIYTLLLALSSVGIPNAIAKLVSEKTALSDYDGADGIFKTALVIFSVAGAALSLGMFLFAPQTAHGILNMDGAKYTLAALSPSIFFVCVSSVFRGYFSGINKMYVMSVSQIIEQMFKSVLTIMFVFAAVGKAPEIMAGIANFATTVSTAIAAVYLLCSYKHGNKRKTRIVKGKFWINAKSILAIAVPISVCSVISAINRIIDTATVTRGIEEAFKTAIPAALGANPIQNPTAAQLNAEAVRLSGILAKSDTLMNLPLALNIAFATVLVPSISRCMAEKNVSGARVYITSSFLVSAVLILPCAAGYAVLAKPIYSLIYPNAPLGYELLQLGTLSLIFTAMNQTVTGALQGMGKVHVPAAALAVGCAVKLAVNHVLIRIPQINIYGAVIGSVFCQLAVFAVEFYSLYKSSDGINMKVFAKPAVCTAVMSAAAYFLYKFAYGALNSSIAAVGISIVVSAAIYMVMILRLKVFTAEQLSKIPILGKYIPTE